MTTLFEMTKLGNVELQNRFVRSATWEGLAGPGGYATERLTRVLMDLAKGGVGLIITGHSYISEEGQAGPFQLGIYHDDQIPGCKQLSSAVHQTGGKIVMQLAHAGCRAASKLTGRPPIGPSAMEMEGHVYCSEMTREEIRKVARAFGKAAARAKEAGFDGVQIHAAHGYLLSQFLSPFFNKRQDEYGGSVENRTRMLMDAVEAVRKSVGNNFAVLIKINSEDFLDGGFTVTDMITTAQLLEQKGVEAIELSGGTFYSGAYSPSRVEKATTCKDEEVYYLSAATRYKEKIRTPLILVGGIRSYDVAEKLVTEGTADYIALCRPLISEPGLVNRWKSGDTNRAACRSDNLCFKPGFEGRGVYCVTAERQRKRQEHQEA